MKTSINQLREFCQRHSIKVIDTNKRAHSIRKIDASYFVNHADYNYVDFNTFTESEPLYTVEITESELNRIADFESMVFNHMQKHGHYNLFTTVMEQKEREKYLREKYPAVAAAYRNYSLILKMAESGEL